MPSFPFVFPQLMNLTPLAASGNSNPINIPPKSGSMLVVVHIKFTLGSLTNASFTVQALNPDGSTWESMILAGSTALGTGTITASGNYALGAICSGVKQIRVTYTTTGTVTSSAAIIDATTSQ